MYRVLFRVIKINIHIKEHLLLEIVFKKGSESIVGNELYSLVDGIANVNVTNQFLINKHHPVFEVHVNFTFKKVKKQAGFIQLNLHDWSINQSYQEIRTLQNSPGGKAFMQFGFIYLDFGVNNLIKELQSLQAFQKSTNEQYRSLVEQQNYILTQKLQELKHQKQQLTQQNWNLSKMEDQYNKIEANLTEEMSEQIKRMNESQNSLKEEEQKSSFLMELVRKSGSQTLMKSVNQFVQNEIQKQEKLKKSKEKIEIQ